MTKRAAFEPSFAELPPVLPIFPLNGVLLLPRGQLPLNIFEPRYLAMTRDALGRERMIGMVQPREGHGGGAQPPVYATGCAGRITSFRETEDGRFLITLTGVARFEIIEELAPAGGYRRVTPGWERFRDDLLSGTEAAIERPRLLVALKPFLAKHGITCEWQAIEQTPDERLVTTIAMVCPFEPNEKQALLEAGTLAERAKLLTAFIEMAALRPGTREAARH